MACRETKRIAGCTQIAQGSKEQKTISAVQFAASTCISRSRTNALLAKERTLGVGPKRHTPHAHTHTGVPAPHSTRTQAHNMALSTKGIWHRQHSLGSHQPNRSRWPSSPSNYNCDPRGTITCSKPLKALQPSHPTPGTASLPRTKEFVQSAARPQPHQPDAPRPNVTHTWPPTASWPPA